jgi:hypothetical protein
MAEFSRKVGMNQKESIYCGDLQPESKKESCNTHMSEEEASSLAVLSIAGTRERVGNNELNNVPYISVSLSIAGTREKR